MSKYLFLILTFRPFFEQKNRSWVERLLPLKVLLTQFRQQRLKVQTLQKSQSSDLNGESRLAKSLYVFKSCDQIFLVLQWQHAYLDRHRFVKFIYSEKATKFCEISTLILTTVHTVKSKVEISQNFVAFSEYMNFDFNILKVYETTPTLIQILFHKKRAYHRTL